jgi:predicted SnoaL-like aldol condensation-catalyzing enzyme
MNSIDESARSKAIALKAIRGVFIERDPRVVHELFAPDYIQHNPTIPNGRDAIAGLLGSLPEGFRYEPGMVAAEGSIVMIHGRYLVDRGSEQVLAYCDANNIGFIPWFPLEAGELTRPGGLVDRVAKARGATAGQVALAWLLQRSPVILPIPGTVRVAHLEQNVAASSLSLTSEEVAELDTAA